VSSIETVTGQGEVMDAERVTALRSHHRIPRYNPEHKHEQGWVNLTESSRVSAHQSENSAASR